MTRTTSFTFAANNGATGQFLTGHVECQAGETVVGGGTSVAPDVSVGGQPNTQVIDDRPGDASGGGVGNGDAPRGWYAQAERNTDAVAQTVTVSVLCAS